MIFEIFTNNKIYPQAIKKITGEKSPSPLYYAGNIELLDHKLVGFVGSRNVCQTDIEFTEITVEKAVLSGFGIISGGAKGVDTAAALKCLDMGGICVEFLSDSLSKKLRDDDVKKRLETGRYLILSAVHPDAGFTVGIAMMRNKFIYALSCGTVAVKSDFGKGGTWTGASDNLKKKYCPLFCWNNPDYKGNTELIKMGAYPIDAEWCFDINTVSENSSEQISMLDLL